MTTPQSIQNPVVYNLHIKPQRPPGPSLIMGYPHSQTINTSQDKFNTERLSLINRPTNQPTTSTTSKYINTVPRLSAHISATPTQNPNQNSNPSKSEIIQGVVDEFIEHYIQIIR